MKHAQTSSQTSSKLRQLNWETQEDDGLNYFDDQDYFQPQSTKSQTGKDLTKQFQKLHNKIQVNKNKRTQQGQNIAVPQNRDALLLKYGPNPNAGPRASKKNEQEMPSYKKDAMKLIINRIYRYIGNVFDDMQKKVMRDDIMKQRRELYQLRKESERKKIKQQEPLNSSKQALLDILNKDKQDRPNFKELFEKKKQRILDQLQQVENQQNEDRINIMNKFKGALDETSIENQSLFDQPLAQDGEQSVFNSQILKEEIKLNSFQDNSISAIESRKSRPLNNRYNSEYLDAEEEQCNEEEMQSQIQNLDKSIQDQYQTRRSQDIQNQTILETDQTEESSPEQQENSEILQSEPMPQKEPDNIVILPSIKKEIKSYLSQKRENQDQTPKRSGHQPKTKSQDLVEISFSENPFYKRQSIHNQHSPNGIDRETNQHSPDFKRSTMNSQQSLHNQNNLMSQKALLKQNDSQSLNQTLEFSLAKDPNQSSKPKFSEQLKKIMTDLETKQQTPNLSNQTQILEESSQIIQEEIIQEEPAAQIVKENKTNATKLTEMRRKLTIQKDKSGFHRPEEIVQNQTSNENSNYNTADTQPYNVFCIDTPLGKMTKLAENQVMFEESRQEKKAEEDKQLQKFEMKKKKQAQMSQMFNIQEQEHQLLKEKKMKSYSGNISLLYQVLERKILKIESEVIMELIKHQLNCQKVSFVDKIRNKSMMRQAFKKLLRNTKKRQSLDLVHKFLMEMQRRLEKRGQACFWQWKMTIKLAKDQEQLKQKEAKGKSLMALALIVKHKQQQNIRNSYDAIFNYNLQVKKINKENSQKRSLQMITTYLKNKQTKFLNKKFQKYRKIIFLLAFDMKLMKLTSLLNDRIVYNKKECFKELINFCIRNDPYKKQVELLNNEFQLQKIKMATQQFNRLVKIVRTYHLKDGFSSLVVNHQVKTKQEKMAKRMIKIFQKYEQFTQQIELSRSLQKWHKQAARLTKIKQQKTQACKKLKLLISVSSMRLLKQRFDYWKQETANFINIELTKFNQEKTQARNMVLDQVIANLWWATLSNAFSQIKRRAKIQKQFEFILKKQEVKRVKISKQEAINNWKNAIYRNKLIRVNLAVIIKNRQAKINKKIQEAMRKWRLYTKNIESIENKIQLLVKKKAEKIQNQHKQSTVEALLRWKQKVNKQKRAQVVLQNIVHKNCGNNLLLAFEKWDFYNRKLSEFQLKLNSLNKIYDKLKVKIAFKSLKRHSYAIGEKLSSIQILNNFFHQTNRTDCKQAFNQLKTFVTYKKRKLHNQKESIKQIKRLKKTIDFKIMQRFIIRWKLNTIDNKSQQQKQQIQEQYQKRVLSNILNKAKQRMIQQGFGEIKNFIQKEKERQLIQQLKNRRAGLMAEKIQKLYFQQIKFGFSQLNQNYQDYLQNQKINLAISKLSSVTKICGILDKSRLDREYFFRWKSYALKSQAYEYGLNLMDALFLKYKKNQFIFLNQQSQVLLIQKTRQKIGLNVIKMILYKVHKDRLQANFKIWQNQAKLKSQTLKKYNQQPLPPRVKISILENSAKKQKIEVGFMLPPMSNQGNQKIFNQSKPSSHQNSVGSQKNMRYSQRDDDEQEDDNYFFDCDNTHYQNSQEKRSSSQEKQIILKPKISFGSYSHRDSMFSNRSNSNGRRGQNRYSPSQECDEFKIQPIEISGQPFEIFKEEQPSEQKKKSPEKYKRQSSNSQKQSVNHSRNYKKDSLNKYLSNNSQQQSQEVKKSKVSQKRKSERSLAIMTSESQASLEISKSNRSQKDDEEQLSLLLKSQSQSKILSPRGQLEPVPEVEEITNPSTFQQNQQPVITNKKHSVQISVNNKLSSFLNANLNKEKNKKVMKQKSRENNEKFKVFLGKKNSTANAQPYQEQSKLPQHLLTPSGSTEQIYSVSLADDSFQNVNHFNQSNIEKGIDKIERFMKKKVVENIIGSAFTAQNEQRYQQRRRIKQAMKLQRLAELKDDIVQRDIIMKQEAFLRWKRSDYMMMLQSLKLFNQNISQLYQIRI